MDPISVAGVVVAAGSGTRLGASVPKAFVRVGGRTLLRRAVDALHAAGVRHVVAVVPQDLEGKTAAALGPSVTVVRGGATRMESVAAGFAATNPQADAVAVHDAARAFMPSTTIAAAVAAVRGDVLAAAPGVGVSDTIKAVNGVAVTHTVPRDGLVAIQTPQVVRRWALGVALDHARQTGLDHTDDLGVVEAAVAAGLLQGRVVTTQGSSLGRKITQPEDLVLAREWAAQTAGEMNGQ